MTHSRLVLLALTFALVGPWGLAAPARGQSLKLDDRLAPPATMALPALPTTSEPTPRESLGKGKTQPSSPARPQPPLPISEVPRTTTAPSGELKRAAWKHPALDSPEIASTAQPTLPIETRLPVTGGAFVRGPNPDQPLADLRTPRDVEGPPALASDPKAIAAFRFLTSPVAAAPPSPAPLLRMSIPDPWGALQQSRLPVQDLDRDPPTVPLDRPAR